MYYIYYYKLQRASEHVQGAVGGLVLGLRWF